MKNYANSSTIYVSQKAGNDLFSGFTSTNNGFGDGPIKTIDRALEMVKSMRICKVLKPVTIKIMDDYYLSSPIVLDESVNDICFESFGNTKNRIIGGKHIDGFKKDKLNGFDCVSVYLDDVKSGIWNFTDLYVNGKNANLARFPKNDFFKAEQTEFNKTTDAFKPSSWFIAEKNTLEHIEDLENCILSFCHYFIDEHTPIESYDKKSRKVTLKYLPCMTMNTNYDSPNSSTFFYYLENIKQGFNEQGDWFLDVKNGKLYYYPLDNENIENLEIFAPTTSCFFSIEGNNDRARNIRFQNLIFTCTKGDYIGQNRNLKDGLYASDEQSWAYSFGAMRFKNADNCSIYDCEFYALGLYAIELISACQNIRVEKCDIHDLGGGGIKVLGADKSQAKEQQCTHNVFSNNHIYRCGRRYYASCGILLCHSSYNEISNNTVHDINYTGISVGWIWGYDDSNSHSNLIKHNHVYNIGMGPLSDMGAIYLLGKQPGTVVQYNIVHDVLSKHGGTYGLYADEGTSYVTFENNVVYNTMLASMHVHLGNENVIRNNVFAFGKRNIINVSMRENHNIALFEENVFIAEEEKIYGNSYKDNVYPNPSFYSDNNLIIGLNKKPLITKIGTSSKEIYLDKWKSVYGLDKNSKTVIFKQNLHEYFDNIPFYIEKIGIEETVKKVLKKFKNN